MLVSVPLFSPPPPWLPLLGSSTASDIIKNSNIVEVVQTLTERNWFGTQLNLSLLVNLSELLWLPGAMALSGLRGEKCCDGLVMNSIGPKVREC